MRGARIRLVASVVVTAAVLAACGGDGGPSPATAATPSAKGAAAPAAACAPAPIEQRAAAVLIVGLPAVTESSDSVVAQVLENKVGGVLITEPNVRSSAQVGQLVSDIRARAGRPLIVAT